MLTVTNFREKFPEFSAELYPDIAVETRLNLAGKFFTAPVWDDELLRNHAIGLYTAHYLTITGSSKSGGTGYGGDSLGVVSSKSVDGVSVSYDTATSALQNAGNYNLSIYGRELWDLMLIVGGGGVQI